MFAWHAAHPFRFFPQIIKIRLKSRTQVRSHWNSGSTWIWSSRHPNPDTWESRYHIDLYYFGPSAGCWPHVSPMTDSQKLFQGWSRLPGPDSRRPLTVRVIATCHARQSTEKNKVGFQTLFTTIVLKALSAIPITLNTTTICFSVDIFNDQFWKMNQLGWGWGWGWGGSHIQQISSGRVVRPWYLKL